MQDPTPGSTAAEGAAAISIAEDSNRPLVGRKDKLEEDCVNTIRFLAVDAVEKAKKLLKTNFSPPSPSPPKTETSATKPSTPSPVPRAKKLRLSSLNFGRV